MAFYSQCCWNTLSPETSGIPFANTHEVILTLWPLVGGEGCDPSPTNVKNLRQVDRSVFIVFYLRFTRALMNANVFQWSPSTNWSHNDRFCVPGVGAEALIGWPGFPGGTWGAAHGTWVAGDLWVGVAWLAGPSGRRALMSWPGGTGEAPPRRCWRGLTAHLQSIVGY